MGEPLFKINYRVKNPNPNPNPNPSATLAQKNLFFLFQIHFQFQFQSHLQCTLGVVIIKIYFSHLFQNITSPVFESTFHTEKKYLIQYL